MEKTKEIVNVLSDYIILKGKSLTRETSPEEILALAELVRAVNTCSRYVSSYSEAGINTIENNG